MALKHRPFLVVTDFEGLNAAVMDPSEAAGNHIFFSLSGQGNTTGGNGNSAPESNSHSGYENKNFRFIPLPVEFTKYRNAFDIVSRHLKRGDTYLINLTFPTDLDTDLDLDRIFRMSQAPFKLLFGDCFTVFSPEPFVRIEDGVIRSNPMKGTIDAGILRAEELLLNDRKELFEHNTIVDLIRNDLSMISSSVKVDRFRYIERIRTNRKDLFQMSSEISGRLSPGYPEHLGEVIFRLLPAGSVSGAPKEKTVEIIHKAEEEPRGCYTGIFGYFDGKDFSSAVMIRFIEQHNGRLRFRSGGGITALSDCESEYRELIDKVYVTIV